MKVTREKTENSQAFLTVEMEPAEVEDALKGAYRQLVKKVNVPGFRKGKAPREILERHMGRERFLDEALSDLIPQAYEKALAEQEIEAITRPQVEIVTTEPVVFKAVVPMRPTVELGDYRQVRVPAVPVEVTEENIDAVIEQLRHQHATWEPVERPAQEGDMLVIDIDGQADGESLISRQGLQFQVISEQVFIGPGFSQQMVGMNIAEEKEFDIEYPADYPSEALAGKKALFKVKVNEVKEEKLPELNDEFVQTAEPEIKTVDGLREEAASRLRQRAEERARAEYEEKAIEAIVEGAKVEFPPVLVEAEIDRMISQQLQQWQMAASGLDEYLKNVGKTEKELREELQAVAEKRVVQSLVLGRIAEEEKVEVGDADIAAEIERVVAESEKKEELSTMLNTPEYREAIRQSLYMQQTVRRLTDIAGGEVGKAPDGADAEKKAPQVVEDEVQSLE